LLKGVIRVRDHKRKTLPNGKIQYVVYKDDMHKMSTVSMLEAQSYVDAHILEDKNKCIAVDRLAEKNRTKKIQRHV
jgi:hypothetical protein